MRSKLLTLALLAVAAISVSSCSYQEYQPERYGRSYRTYQDRDHGGMNETYSGTASARRSPNGYLKNGKHDRNWNGYILGGTF